MDLFVPGEALLIHLSLGLQARRELADERRRPRRESNLTFTLEQMASTRSWGLTPLVR